MRKSLLAISAVGVFLVAFLAVVEAQTISTLAGGGPNNLSATSSGIGTPWAVVQDSTGNTYISDNLSNRIFKVDSHGNLTVLAGNIVANYNGDNHLATVASLNGPQGIAVGSNGIVYIADTGNNAIRVVNTQMVPVALGGSMIPAGFIETIAGTGTPGYTGPAPVTATSAQLNSPSGVWLDATGNVYIADTNNSVIEVVNLQASAITIAGVMIPANDLATVAGNNAGTFGGDNGPATSASINHPLGVFVDAATGTIFIADTLNNRIRAVNPQAAGSITVATKVIAAGNITTIAGNGTEGYSGDGVAGQATSAELNHPSAVASDGLSDSSNLYIADGDNLPPPQTVVTSNEVIRMVDSTGTITTFAGTGTQCFFNNAPCGDGGPAVSAFFWAPTGVFVDGSEDLFIADQNDDAIREVSGGNIQTAMGVLLDTSYAPYPVTLTSAAANAELHRPAGIAADTAGNAYVADTFNNAIRKVDLSGNISTVVGNGFGCNTLTCGDGGPAGSATVSLPFAVTFDNAGNMYVADSGDNVVRVVNNQATAITLAGQMIQPGDIRTIAGNGTPCSAAPCGDGGASTSAQLNLPEGLSVDNGGNLFIADTNDNAIRVVNTTTTSHTVATVPVPAGAMVTVAGAANPTSACAIGTDACGDALAATSALLSAPGGVGLDSLGNIYLADTNDNRVRVVNASSGIINAFAGTGAPCTSNCLNGGLATSALLDSPQSVFVDFASNVFVADAFDFEVREVTKSNGNIQGVAGNETRGFYGDGGPATSAQLGVPFGVSGDSSGNLLIADLIEWRVRKVSGLVTTAPLASLSPGSVTFPAQGLNSKSAPIPVTLSNTGNGTNLTVTNIAISGADKADFAQTNNCSSVPGPGNCTINVTITPLAAGARNAVLMVTDNAGGSPQSINLTGTGSAPTAALSPGSLTFPAQALNTKSAVIPVTLSNTVNGADLTVTSVAISGADKADFAQTNNCTSVLGPGNCTISVTITPSAAGARNAVLMVTDDAAGSPQSINLSGTGEDFSIPKTGTLSNPTVSAGTPATATITITPGAGLAATVDLTCAVTPATSVPPTCALSPSSLTPGHTTSLLTVSTVAATSGALVEPSILRRSAPLYAVWLLLPGMLLSTAGVGASRRRKLLSYFLLFCAVAGCLFLVACGGGSSSSGGGGGGGGSAGTTAGAYTVTVTAKTSTTAANQTFPLTVQ